MKKEIRILKEHSKKCCIAGKDNMWHSFEKYYYGNWAGMVKEHGNWHRWFMFRCNDPRCKYLLIVEDEAINRFLNKVVEDLK